MSSLLVLTDPEIEGLIGFDDAIELVEKAFIADARGAVATLPVLLHSIPEREASFGIKASHLYIPNEPEVIGLKAGWFSPGNAVLGLPGHLATILLVNPRTGEAVALMSGNSITTLRTAAGGAVAARVLSRPGSARVAVLGAGVQAYAQLQALRQVRDVRHVCFWARRVQAAQALAGRVPELSASVCSTVEETVRDADIVITTTPSREPLLHGAWVKPGTHVNAIGADGKGKRELDDELLAKAHFVADKRVQSATIGEWQYANRPAEFAELGEICVGLRPGRQSSEEITVFDSSGVSFQDVIVAGEVMRRAMQGGIGRTLEL